MTYDEILAAQKKAHAGDAADFADLLADDFEWTSLSRSSMGSQKRGKAETLDWAKSTEFTFYEVNVLLETDEAIVVEERVEGTSLGADTFVVMTFCRLRDGKVSEMRHVRGLAAA